MLPNFSLVLKSNENMLIYSENKYAVTMQLSNLNIFLIKFVKTTFSW